MLVNNESNFANFVNEIRNRASEGNMQSQRFKATNILRTLLEKG